ncbi:MAG: carbon-nitrogen hydrolase family protein [Bryobacterales bacterium]|nr:carbon-nitrogen hydrolase family protein [Bryobacterales bacterium]
MGKYLIPFLLLAALFGAEPAPNRIVRVVAVSQDGLNRSNPAILDDTLERLERASAFRPDIAALPEVFVPGEPETVPGPVTRRLAEWAKRNGSYVLFGIRTHHDGRVYNSAVLLDRQGGVVGLYDKTHPTEGEMQEGVSPGKPGGGIFQTDFGTIGVQICFDANWPDDWKALKAKGAQIVFFPAAYPAHRQVSAIAVMNQFYVVSPIQDRSSRIYDITGDVLAVSGRFQPWAGAALPLGKRLFEIDFNTRKAREMQRKYGDRVDLEWFHDDDWFTLASRDPDLTVDRLMAEYGLTPIDEYRKRAEAAIRAARAQINP